MSYPEVGNGGYTSVHTATHTVYDATNNRFLPGNHVDLTDRANRCLSSLSLDFERFEPGRPAGGPDMRVRSVEIDRVPASFRFAQPTYPGDPRGPDDRDPRAHEVSQHDPVGGPDRNPLPPACSPELTEPPSAAADPESHQGADSQDGNQCPADKLVLTPRAAIPAGHTFTITVGYTGTPGVHHDGDGSEEGWFRASDGDWMATEPVGSEDWMPLNDYPSEADLRLLDHHPARQDGHRQRRARQRHRQPTRRAIPARLDDHRVARTDADRQLREALEAREGSEAGTREVEYAVLDRNGRLQLPARMTERLGMRDRVRLDERANHIAVWPGGEGGDADRAGRRA